MIEVSIEIKNHFLKFPRIRTKFDCVISEFNENHYNLSYSSPHINYDNDGQRIFAARIFF